MRDEIKQWMTVQRKVDEILGSGGPWSIFNECGVPFFALFANAGHYCTLPKGHSGRHAIEDQS